MSDAQQGLPRYTGTGAFGKVADALNLHSGCIEDLDATGMVSNARYSGRSGSVTARPRAPRSGSANHAGDFKRFAMRIAYDTEGNLMLFIGKGGVQVETSGATTRIAIEETKKALIEDGIVYIDYTKGAATLEYGTEISPEAEHYYVRIGKTSKHVDATDNWALPEQWLTTDAYLMLQGDSRVDDIIDVLPPDPVVTRDDGTTETKPDGTPVRSFADDYSFRCRVAKDGTTWKLHITDGIVHGRGAYLANFGFGIIPVSATVLDAPAASTDLFLVVTKTATGGEGGDVTVTSEFVFGTYEEKYRVEAVTPYHEEVVTVAGPVTTTSNSVLTSSTYVSSDSASAVTQISPEQRGYFCYNVTLNATSASVIASVTSDNVYMNDGYTFPSSVTATRVFRIASVTITDGIPTIVQRQFGDISADFDSRIEE